MTQVYVTCNKRELVNGKQLAQLLWPAN